VLLVFLCLLRGWRTQRHGVLISPNLWVEREKQSFAADPQIDLCYKDAAILGFKPNFDCVEGGPSSENSFTCCGSHTVQLQNRFFFGGLTHDHLPFLLLHRERQIVDVRQSPKIFAAPTFLKCPNCSKRPMWPLIFVQLLPELLA